MVKSTVHGVVLLSLILLSLAAGLGNISCAKTNMGEEAGSPQMSLDSGVDKKTTRYDNDYSMEGEAYGDSGGLRNTIGSSPAAAPPSATENASASGSGQSRQVKKLSVRAAVQESDEARLASWIIPSAYAQDHNINERYMIRTGACTVEVKDYREAAKQVNAIAEKYQGMVSGIQSSRSGEDWLVGTLTLRVPNASFFAAWSEILMLGDVIDEKVGAEDASQQYISTLSQMKNLLAEEAAVKEMYKEALTIQRTRGLNEGYKLLIDTQERLFQISGQIQQTEDQLNALADRITRSTITVTLREMREMAQQAQDKFTWGVGTTAAQAYRDLLLWLRARVNALTYFLITCWTWLIPLAFFGYIAYLVYRRFLAGKRFNFAWAATPIGPAPAASTPIPVPAPPIPPARQQFNPRDERSVVDIMHSIDDQLPGGEQAKKDD